MKKKLFFVLALLMLSSVASAKITSPDDSISYKDAVTAVARIHASYYGNAIENPYDYAVKYGIAADKSRNGDESPVKRAELATLICSSLPKEYFESINNFDEIPDVPESNDCYDSVLTLYNAGILTGTDRFGNFLPEDEVSSTQLSAIVDRLSFEDKRVSFTFTDGNYDDGYYLVNEASAEFSEGSLLNDSPWNYDNRNRIGAISNASYHMHDFYSDGIVSLWRDIENVNRGLVGWDYCGSIQFAGDGLCFYFADDDGNAKAKLEVTDGRYNFCGVDTGVEAKLGSIYFKFICDLDERTAELHLNGEKIAENCKISQGEISRIYISSTEEGISAVDLSRCDVYKDYPVKDIFLMPEDTELSCFDVTGEAYVTKTGGQSYNDIRSACMTAGSVAQKSFKELSGNIIFETYMLLPEDSDEGYIEIKSGENTVAKVIISDYGVFAHDSTLLRHHTNNIWQCVRMELDTLSGKVLFKINGKDTGTLDFASFADSIDSIAIGCTSGNIYFDDVALYMAHNYDDYCPEPEPINDDGYNTILNVCSLWHEGSHSGWGCISAFPDIEPALGFYDEGIPEVADWEIKFMVENGIDVQHLCWYCPSGNITEPIKRSNLNFALHDGFFNAKYSDKMKFMFMWENSGTNCYSLEQFKKYIWSYWVDYYFLDNRYFTMDNKVVFTVWSPSNFRQAFGGTDETVKEAVDFMNEDIKRYGFDGVIILFSDSTQSVSTLTSHASSGASGVYAYHWGQDGNDADKSVARMAPNLTTGALHVVPTVSVGFNNLGWSGTRKPMISVEGHRKVLDYIIDEFLPAKEEGWKQNTLIVSTWNEYGEGTYVMPCKGLNGFGYLENVAETVSGVTDHSNNIYPTEAQKKRLGHMYTTSETTLRKLDYEQREYTEVPAKVLYSATGADVEKLFGLSNISVSNGIYKATFASTDGGVVMADGKDPLVKANDVKAISMTLKTNVSCTSEIYYTNETIETFDGNHRLSFPITASDEFTEYIIYTEAFSEWTGTIDGLRLDFLTKAGTFEFAEIKFLGYTEEQMPYQLFADGTEYIPPFDPEKEDGEIYIVAEPYSGFFSLHNYYYEWSRYTGRLYILASDGTEVVFCENSDTAYVNGNEVQLQKPVTLRDGLPVLPLFKLYEMTGMEYEISGKIINAYAKGKDLYLTLQKRVPYEYEFNIPGDTEGFSGYDTTVAVYDGRLRGVATIRSTVPSLPYDAMLICKNLEIDTTKYKKAIVGMKHNLTNGKTSGKLEIFFLTDSDTTWSQNKSANAMISGAQSEDIVEYTIDFSKNSRWTGTVTDIRVDPIPEAGSYEIDYIRFVVE